MAFNIYYFTQYIIVIILFQISTLKAQYRENIEECILHAFRHWRESNNNPQIKELYDALYSCGRADLAEHLFSQASTCELSLIHSLSFI